MRAVISALFLILVSCPVAALGADSQTQPSESSGVTEDEEDEEDEHSEQDDPKDKHQKIREGWGRIFAPPDEHLWEVDAGIGWMFWENAFGERDLESLYRLRARHLFAAPLSVSLTVDYTSQMPAAGSLQFANRRVGILPGFGLQHWMGRWVLGADIEVGVLYSHRSIDDANGAVDTSNQIEPLAGLLGRTGVSVLGTASISLEAGLRPHVDRLDWFASLQVGGLL